MSFNRQSPNVLSFPGEENRETWTCGANGICRRTEHSSHAPGVLGIETLALDSAPFWFLKREGPDQDVAGAVALRWEALGIDHVDGSTPWAFWPVKETEKQLLIASVAIAEEVPGLQWDRAALFQRFEASARLLPLPSDGMAVWKELGRFVVAFTHRKTLLHTAVLTARVLDADAALEIRDVFQALLAHEFPVNLQQVEVWTACETDFVPQMACLFDEAVFDKCARPDPVLPAEASSLLPVQVAAARREQQARRQRMMMIAAAAAVYVCFFAAWWLRLQWRESQINSASAAIAARQPEIETVREAQTNWFEMEGAIDPNLYPVEIFHQIVSLLPDEGIRLKEFQMDGGKLVVGGEATTVNHALGFKDKLAACKPLQRYAWNFPVPRIRDEDNRAEFRAVGTINGEAANEGQ
ncbi:MAG: hypothetical protein U1F71_18115 [Verrucomicrobiaceae bacterium]